jgi:hypothetical protein
MASIFTACRVTRLHPVRITARTVTNFSYVAPNTALDADFVVTGGPRLMKSRAPSGFSSAQLSNHPPLR